jgi:inositol phosphorylceramide mannosyltransferase catalytic subunit
MKIPKLIHQIIFNETFLPNEITENIRYLKNNNPDFEYKFYDKKNIFNFVSAQYGNSVLSRLKKINPNYGAVLADIFRYLLIYKLGGIYLDVKSTLKKPLQEVIKADWSFIISQWNNSNITSRYYRFGLHPKFLLTPGGEYQNWFIVSEPNHPFLKKVIECVLFNIDNYFASRDWVGLYGVLRLSGPIAYTLAISEVISDSKYKNFDYTFLDASELGFEFSIYADNYSHKKIFRNDYNFLKEPIIL